VCVCVCVCRHGYDSERASVRGSEIPSINVSTMCEPTMLHKPDTPWSVRQTEWPLCLVGEHNF